MVIGAGFLGVFAARLANAKQFLQVASGVVLGLAASVLSTVIGAKKMEKAEDKLLKTHHAEQLFYENNKLIK